MTAQTEMMSEDQRKISLKHTADIAMNLRQMIRASLPTPDEQFLTISIPGKVLNFADFDRGFSSTGVNEDIVPMQVQINEAILADDMPALGPVQLGPTGRSVSRSYSSVLDKLVPSGSTIGIRENFLDAAGTAPPPTVDQKRYEAAMTFLTSVDPSGTTPIATYCKYQDLYVAAMERKETAYAAALVVAQSVKTDTVRQQTSKYDNWVQLHRRTYNAAAQAAYMAWVAIGMKESVEFHFNIIDVSSVMARIENSKESMRNSTIATQDGSAEYQRVELTPSNWAWLAQQKALSTIIPDVTVDSLTMEISSCQVKLAHLYSKQIYAATGTATQNSTLPDGASDPGAANTKSADGAIAPIEHSFIISKLQTATNKLQIAQNAYNVESSNLHTNGHWKEGPLDRTALNAAAAVVSACQDAVTAAQSENAQSGIEDLQQSLIVQADSVDPNIGSQITGLQKTIEELISIRKSMATGKTYEEATTSAVVPLVPAKDPTADPAQDPAVTPAVPAIVAPKTGSTPDYWTTITASSKSSSALSSSESQSTSYSAGGGGGFGFWSAGGSYSHSDSSGNAASAMASCDTTVTFDCMRVDITRPWLRGELFYDCELSPAAGTTISPGPALLAKYMDPQNYTPGGETRASVADAEKSLIPYSEFPMYPVAFILAANTVLEFKGATSAISSHFSNSSDTAEAHGGWGPWSVNTSFSKKSSSESASVESTADGCKITIRAPQIIGVVSQILPALPRRK